jgi:hypothetical protein
MRWRSGSGGSASSTQPVGGGPEVLDVGVERGGVREGLARVGQQACEVGGVAPANLGLLGRVGGQPLGGVLAQQLVHAVAPVLAHLDQGVVDQAGQQGQPGAGHGGGRVQVEAAPHDREAGQGLALAVAEQLPGPVEHRGHAAVARLHVGRGRGQQLAAGASRSAMAAGEAERTQRAASSMASGTPATSRQTRPTAARSAAGRNPGRSSRARSSNSWTAG